MLSYFRVKPPWPLAPLVAVVGVLLLAACFLLAANGLRRRKSGRQILTASFLFVFLVALNAVRQQTTWLAFARMEARVGTYASGAVVVVILILVAICCLRWRRRIAHFASQLMLWMLPFTLFTFGHALVESERLRREAHDFEVPAPASLLPRAPGAPRLVLVVFDNLGQDQALETPPDGVERPAFESLRRSSIECTNAYPPTYSTAMSLASMTTGRQVVEAAFGGPRDLEVRFESETESRSWAEVPSLFSLARSRGVNSSIVGWYHPYCRLFGSSLVSCHFQEFVPEPDASLMAEIRRQATALVDVVPGAIRLDVASRLGLDEPPPDLRAWHLRIYQAIQEQALRAAVDPQLGLVFIHYPIPHDPYIYDRKQRRADIAGESTFADNLSLADVALGELRHAMEEARLWTSSSVVVTTDHWNRKQDDALASSRFPVIGHRIHRVPLLIKLAGQSSAGAFSGVFRTRHLLDLGLGILSGELADPPSLTAWLTHQSEAPTATSESTDRPSGRAEQSILRQTGLLRGGSKSRDHHSSVALTIREPQ